MLSDDWDGEDEESGSGVRLNGTEAGSLGVREKIRNDDETVLVVLALDVLGDRASLESLCQVIQDRSVRDRIRPVLRELCELGLVTSGGTGKYRLLPIGKVFASQVLAMVHEQEGECWGVGEAIMAVVRSKDRESVGD